MHTDVRIVRVEDRGGPIEKKPYVYSAGFNYSVPIRYTLEDGRTMDSTDRHRLLRDAKAYRESLPREPQNMAAVFDEKGECVAIKTSFALGGPRR